MKKSNKEALKKYTQKNTKVAGFVVSSHGGSVACTVERSKKGMVLR